MRIRTIKPSFWTHEDLSALPEPTHMLAAQLLNYADDEGYFNANPGLIRAAVTPLREPSVSIQDSLEHLVKINWITLGTAPDGKRYGFINTFKEHQYINRPNESKIKALGVVWEGSRNAHGRQPELTLPEGKGNKEEGKEDTPPVSPQKAKPKSKKAKPVKSSDLQSYVDAWNETLPMLGQVKGLGEKRMKHLNARIREQFDGKPALWKAYLERIRASDFLMGRVPRRDDHKNWMPTFDWCINVTNCLKILEGNYDNDRGNGGGMETPEMQKYYEALGKWERDGRRAPKPNIEDYQGRGADA